MLELNGKYNTAKVFTDNIEQECISHIIRLLNAEQFSGADIRIMPDTHDGRGCVIGFTMRNCEVVVPNLVGVDISCSVSYVKVPEDIDLKLLDYTINNYVPSGFNVHDQELRFSPLSDLTFKLENESRILKSIGTLGGGNHFIEVSKGTTGTYLIVHSGSRNLGLQVCNHHQKIAGKDELSFLSGSLMEDYLNDVYICESYADLSRHRMLEIILSRMGLESLGPVNTTRHNYIDSDRTVRKGAVSSHLGEELIIPLNMRDGSLLCIGKGNDDWNNSAPHGAGRIMSRSKAKELVNMEDFIESMKGIYTTSVRESTKDESPFAYKDDIEQHIGDTVSVIDRLIPVYNFKA